MNKLTRLGVLVTSVALAGVVGCASDSGNSGSAQPAAQTAQAAPPPQPAPPPKPKKPHGPIENRLHIGMSMDDVRAACGNPRSSSMSSDGSGYWTYASGSPTFNPAPWGGGWGAKVHYVTVVFDTGGKVKSWTTADTDNGPPPPPF